MRIFSNLELGWQSESGPYFWRTLPFRLWQAFFGGNHTHAWNGNCRCTYIGIGDSSTMVASSHSRQQQKKNMHSWSSQHNTLTKPRFTQCFVCFFSITKRDISSITMSIPYDCSVLFIWFAYKHYTCYIMLQPWFCGPWTSHFQPPGLSVTQLPSKPWAHVTVQISPLIT